MELEYFGMNSKKQNILAMVKVQWVKIELECLGKNSKN